MRMLKRVAVIGLTALLCLNAQAKPGESIESIRARYERQRSEVFQKLRLSLIHI